MTLRQKVLLMAGFTLALVVVVLYFLASQILLNGFSSLEREQAMEGVHRVGSALSDELAQLNAKTAEWSGSGALARFMEDGNPKFRDEHTSATELPTLGLNLLLLVNPSGQVVVNRAYDLEEQSESEFSAASVAMLTTNAMLINHTNAACVHAGVVVLPEEGAMLLVARPIMSDPRGGEVRGTVMFGRLMGTDMVRRLGQVARLGVSVRRVNQRGLASDFKDARAVLLRGEQIWIRNISRHRVAAYGMQEDIFGQPALVMQAVMPRDLFVQGQVMTGYLLSSLIAVCLVLGLLVVLMLDSLVLTRLGQLIATVRTVGATGDFASRLPIRGTDELAGVSQAINQMLEALQQSHDQLRENQRMLATLMSNLPGMVYRCQNDHEWTMEFVSEGCRALTGYDQADLIGNHRVSYNELIHPEDRERVWNEVQAALAEDRSFQIQYRIRTLLGEEKRVWEQGRGIRGVHNELLGLEGFAADETERQIAQEQVRLQSAALEAAANAVVITDRSGRIMWVNPAFTRLTGYSSSEAVGQTPRLLRSGKHPAAFYQNLWQTILNGAVWSGEIINCRKDGELYTEEMLVSPVRDKNGTITHFIAIKEDITERKRLQEQLLQSQKMEAVGRLAGGVAHDFNNMLTAIMGYSELIMRDLKEDNPLRRNAAEIEKSAYHAARLTRQLLAFSRKQLLQPRVLNLNQVITDISKMLHRLIGEDIELRTHPAADLGSVKVDIGQIEQVILNLVVNARDAMPLGGVLTVETANVTLTASQIPDQSELTPGEYVALTVTDTGTGMAPETLLHVFEPFFTTKGVSKGTGLGLATCYGIIKQSGGHINVRSQLNQGSTFEILLPRVRESLTPVTSRDVGEKPRGAETILLVEDEEAVRELARTVLSELGYRVFVASNGLEAISLSELQKTETLDLLLTDVVMPQLGGKELAERLHADRPQMKILFTSGYTEDAVVQRGIEGTGVAFLQKPYTPGILAHKVREILDVS